MASGEKLNVKFFLLPRDIQASELSVSVVLSNGPKLNPANVNNWMSRIGDDVLFASQLSLPGTKHSFTYTTFEGEKGSYDAEHDIIPINRY